MEEQKDWPHQTRGLQGIADAIENGKKTILGVAPCGAGKSRMMLRLATDAVNKGGNAIIYLHRRMLLEQLSGIMTDKGIGHGILASGYKPDFDQPMQLAMSDSVYSRSIKKGHWELTENSLVVFDEAHLQTSKKALSLVYGTIDQHGTKDGHYDHAGCTVVGFTATPVDCGLMYEHMVGFGSYKEMRACKAHLPIRVFSPSEISTRGLSVNSQNEYSEKALEPRAAKIIGSAYEGWKRLNPDAKPSILFGPSVPCARWFCHEWMKRGVKAAHIDGEICLIPKQVQGKWSLEQVPSDKESRDEILRMSKSGEIALITNRFVLRESIDLPWLYCGIAATVFGSESTYLQSIGRIQRYHPDYQHKLLIDHGGSFWRHGSPNMDREWSLGDTNKERAKQRIEKAQKASKPEDVEGIQCPKCNGWRTHGSSCPHCGHSHARSVRPVMELDGELRLQMGAVNRKKKNQTDQDRIWLGVLYGSAKRDRTVGSAVAVWYARCKDAGIHSPKLESLKHRPPSSETAAWHRSVKESFPWVKPKS